jgi:hypothetical protein
MDKARLVRRAEFPATCSRHWGLEKSFPEIWILLLESEVIETEADGRPLP